MQLPISVLSLAKISVSSVTKIGEVFQVVSRFKTHRLKCGSNLRPHGIPTLEHRLVPYSIYPTKSIVMLCRKPKTHYPNAIIAAISITLSQIAVSRFPTIYSGRTFNTKQL